MVSSQPRSAGSQRQRLPGAGSATYAGGIGEGENLPMPGRSIEFPEVRQSVVHVELVGITPLIVHRFGESAIKAIQDSQGGAARLKKQPRDPEREFREALYLIAGTEQHRYGDLAQCRFGFPARAIKRSLVTAGQRFADEKGTELMGLFSPLATMIEITGSPPTMGSDMVRLGGPSRVTSIAYRPYFADWRMQVPLEFLSDLLTLPQLLNLVRLAGMTVGLGDWRVDHKGVNGQFKIGAVRVEEEAASTGA